MQRGRLLLAVVALALGLTAGIHAAERPAPSGAARTSAPAAPGKTSWSALTLAQKAALAPLSENWHTLSEARQQKWLQVAGRLDKLPEAERLRIQERMSQWSKLTPEKRALARRQFLEAKQLPAPQRQARWEEYQALPAEDKSRFAAEAKALKSAKALPPKSEDSKTVSLGKLNEVPAVAAGSGKAATAVAQQAKPGATTRALTTPVAPPPHHQAGLPKIVASEGFVDPATLLPKRGPQGAAVRSSLSGATPSSSP